MKLSTAVATACVAGVALAGTATAQAPARPMAQLTIEEGIVMAKYGAEMMCELTEVDPETPQPPLPQGAYLENKEELLWASAIIGSVASCEMGDAPEGGLPSGAYAMVKVEEGKIMASYGAEASCELGVVEGEPAPNQHTSARLTVEEGKLMATAVVVDRFECELGEADPSIDMPPPFVPPPTGPPTAPPACPQPIPQAPTVTPKPATPTPGGAPPFVPMPAFPGQPTPVAPAPSAAPTVKPTPTATAQPVPQAPPPVSLIPFPTPSGLPPPGFPTQ